MRHQPANYCDSTFQRDKLLFEIRHVWHDEASRCWVPVDIEVGDPHIA